MSSLIATLYLGRHFVLRQGTTQGISVPPERFNELCRASKADAQVPDWMADAARRLWDIDVAGQPMNGTVLVRPDTPYGYSRASYELNLGCNYDCEHCYLGLKQFKG